MFEAAPTDRLFLGLFPDPVVLPRIQRVIHDLPREVGGSRAQPRTDRFHVTVHHLGDHEGLEPARVDAAMEVLGEVRAPAFEIALDEVSSFRGGRKHPIVLVGRDGSPGAHALWKASRDVLVRTPFARSLQRTYTPHLTLLYGDRMLASPVVIEAVGWRVDRMALVHSLPGRSEYRILGSWPLA